jgi:enoyl-CoA hydratase/carnithine racemase
MLLHCDLVLATPNARFKLPFVDLGLVPEFGSSLLLPRLMGHQRAAELFLLCDTFDVDTAYFFGLVNRVVPSDALLSEAQALARRIARKPREAVQRTKGLLRRGSSEAVMARIAEERELTALGLRSEAFRDAIEAFARRRSEKAG